LHTQLNILVTVLALDGNDTELATMFAGLADTAASAEPLLACVDPVVSLEIRSALTHAGRGHRDNARSDLLIASHRLARLLRRTPRSLSTSQMSVAVHDFGVDPDVRFGVSGSS